MRVTKSTIHLTYCIAVVQRSGTTKNSDQYLGKAGGPGKFSKLHNHDNDNTKPIHTDSNTDMHRFLGETIAVEGFFFHVTKNSTEFLQVVLIAFNHIAT